MKIMYPIWIALYSVVFLLPASTQSPILEAEVRFVEQTTTIKRLLEELGEAGEFTFSYGKEVPVDRTFSVTDEKKSI
ncbi:MAG: hypothetical protein KAT15_17725, partial [Bacteroidales bacterium]|nr:hypothetical protein [Bacteroidales bacterium]